MLRGPRSIKRFILPSNQYPAFVMINREYDRKMNWCSTPTTSSSCNGREGWITAIYKCSKLQTRSLIL